MSSTFIIAVQEVRAGLRNRWVLATTLLLAALALSLTLLGSAPVGGVKADPLSIVVVSLASLSIFLLPLIALLLSFDSVVGEAERGTLLLLLAYPLARWQVVLGKFIGHVAILALATVIGYGAAAAALVVKSGNAAELDWAAFSGLLGSSVLLGAAFLALGMLISTVVRERATAAGVAVGIWFVLVLIYDAALLGVLVAGQNRILSADSLDLLLLANPADAFRLLNLTVTDGAKALSGMAGLGEAGRLPMWALLGSLAAWSVVPLAAAVAIFNRREP
ncbi:ABC transporter permease [Aestuariispira ectoiniformans]|uniref:ABC transporter permease n=1 Tax=Aestuariispira ectoiniformans TaxID=2775080 RepID=UPI00223AC6C9|nr:ABC transporter permease [Aestuariispira ectoiniformans]